MQTSDVPALGTRFGRTGYRVKMDSVLADTAWHFAVSRTIYLLAFLLGATLMTAGDPRLLANRDQSLFLPSPSALLHTMERSATAYGDFGWYDALARQGYDRAPYDLTSPIQHNWPYFPLQGWLIPLIQLPSLRFALPIMLSFCATLLMSVNLKTIFGAQVAQRAMRYMLYYPFSMTLSQFRPECVLFFAFALALFLKHRAAIWRGWGWAAAAPLMLAGFCKPNGFLIAIFWLPDVIKVFRNHGLSRRSLAVAAVPAAAGLGIVAMSIWMFFLTGSPLAWAKAQSAWGAQLWAVPAAQIGELLTQPVLIGRWGWDLTLENWGVFACVLLSAALLLWRRHLVPAAFLVSTSMLSFMNFGVWVHGRHMASTFALFAGLGLVAAPEFLVTGIIAIMSMLLALNGFLCAGGFRAFLA